MSMFHPVGHSFELVMRHGPCAELAGTLPECDRPSVVVCHPDDRAIVLGSMQQFGDCQVARARSEGFETVRRMSGGGGLVIEPDEVLWIDLFVPVDDPGYLRDIRKGAYVVGEMWIEALCAIGCDPSLLEVHRAAMTMTPSAQMSCFAGLGPGEVTLDGKKVMGLSQRRIRSGAWYFTLVQLGSNAARDARLLAPDPESERALRRVLEDVVGTVDAARDQLSERFLSVLGGHQPD